MLFTCQLEDTMLMDYETLFFSLLQHITLDGIEMAISFIFCPCLNHPNQTTFSEGREKKHLCHRIQ